MTSVIGNIFEVAETAFLFALYAILLGLAAQAAMPRGVRFPRGLGLAAGMGICVTAVTVVLSYRFLRNATLPLLPLAVIAVVILAIRVALCWPASRMGGPSSARMFGSYLSDLLSLSDLVAICAAVLIMVPVLGYGLTYWTSGINDFPSYAASADIWMYSEKAFAAKHPDAFGALQLSRASFEKPMVTALLVAASWVSNVRPVLLLPPAMLLLLYVLVANLITLCRHSFRTSLIVALFAVLIPTFSVVPISRVYDAQLGQVMAVALLACLLVVVSVGIAGRGLRNSASLAILGGIVGATALGSNFTLVCGSAIAVVALAIWLLSMRPQQTARRLKVSALAAGVALVISEPLAGWYYNSFTQQTTGEPGFDIPLTSPLAIFGLQGSIFGAMPQAMAAYSWIILAILLYTAIIFNNCGRISYTTLYLILLSSVIANITILGIKLGWANYAVFKWFALVVALAAPPMLTVLIATAAKVHKVLSFVASFCLLATSIYLCLSLGAALKIVIDPELVGLVHSKIIESQVAINLRLGNIYANSFAAINTSAKMIIVTERTYAPPGEPAKGPFLLPSDGLEKGNLPDVVKLNGAYSLVSDVSLFTGGEIEFNNKHQGLRRLLYGAWSYTEDWGTWSSGSDSAVHMDLPRSIWSQGILVTVTGKTFSTPTQRQTMELLVNGTLALVVVDRPRDAGSFNFSVSSDVLKASNGRLTMAFRILNLLSPADVGSPDTRKLGFGLEALNVRSRVSPGS